MSNLKQKRFVDTDYFHEQLDSTTVEVEGSHISATETKIGYLKDVEILGNTIQSASNLADIRSVGDKLEGQELYEISVESVKADGNLIPPECKVGELFKVYIPKGEYTTSCKSSSCTIRFYRKDKSLIDYWSLRGEETIYRTFTTPEDIYYVLFDGDENTTDIQVIKGNTLKPYAPYQSDKLTILSPAQLEKVGDVADRIICKDGVWGVEKNVVDTILNGNENWSYSSTTKEFILSSSIYNHLQYSKGGRCISDKLEYSDSTTSTKDNVISVGNSAFLTIRKDIYTNLTDFKKYLSEDNILVKYLTTKPQFMPLPHDQQIKLRTFANKTNISFGCEIEGTIKAQVPKSLGATVNTHTEQISNLNKELDRVKKLEESTVSTVETESDFTTVEATSNGYFEDVKLEGKTLVNVLRLGGDWFEQETTLQTDSTIAVGLSHCTKSRDLSLLKNNTVYTIIPFVDYTVIKKGELYLQLNTEINGTSNAIFKITEDMFNKPTLITTKELTNKNSNSLFLGGLNCEYKFKNVKILVLEGDHTQNPPNGYIEGLKSVGEDTDEISVKSVNGDGNLVEFLEVGGTVGMSGNFGTDYNNKIYFRSNYINVQGLNTISYSFSHKDKAVKDPLYCFYDKNKKGIPPYRIGVTVDVPSSAKYVRFEGQLDGVSDTTPYINDINLMISAGDVPKPYTPHISDKKRLLYYNEETQSWEKPILRQWDSIEKHSDGKYYYHQRSAEVVLNGSESWTIGGSFTDTTLLLFVKPSEVPKSYTWGICDKFNFQTSNNESIRNTEYIFVDTDINIRIAKSRLSTQDVQGFKQWLQANNVTVVYQLAQEKVYECTNIDLLTYANETNYIVESGVIVPKTTLKVHNNISNVVSLLQKKVSLLEAELYNYKVNQNLRQLRTFYKSDYANFGVATVNSTFVAPTSLEITPYGYDLFELFKEIISEGKDCYDRIELEEYIDFYVMTFIFDFEMAFELFDMIDSQHLDTEIEDEPIEDEENSEIIEDEPIDPDFSVDYEEPTIEEDIDVEMGVIPEDDLIDIEMGVIPNEDIDVEFSVDVEEEDPTKDEDLEV